MSDETPLPSVAVPPAEDTTPAPAASQPADGPRAATDAPATVETPSKDVAMTDAASVEQAPSPAPAAPATNSAQSPAPARTSTPARTNGQEHSSSRAASQHPDPGFTMPAEAPPHGAPVRQYLNSKVVGVLTEGMKKIAKEKPSDPLRVLGEYLLKKSKELES